MAKELKFKTTADIKVPDRMIDQVLGQDHAVDLIKKSANQRRHVLLIGAPGTGKCVGKDTEILTEYGPVPAKALFAQMEGIEVKKGEETYRVPASECKVFSLNREGKIVKKPIRAAYRGRRKKAIKIITRSGTEFVVSGEHPVMTLKGQKLVFVPADELSEETFIATARHLPFNSNNVINYQSHPNIVCTKNHMQWVGRNGVRSLTLKIPNKITSDLAYFLGVCVAEARWQGNFIIYNQSQKIKDILTQCLKNVFEYPEKYIKQTEKGIFLKKSRTLAHILQSCFNFPLETTKQSGLKKVPKVLFSASNDVVAQFLAGLIDGDGHVGKKGFELTSKSKELIDGVRLLLLRFGILSRVHETYKASQSQIKRKYYRLAIYDSHNIMKLNRILSLQIPSKEHAFRQFQNKSSNTNVDIIPGLGVHLAQLKKELNIRSQELQHHPGTFSKLIYNQRQISRRFAQELIKKYKKKLSFESSSSQLALLHSPQLTELEQLVHADIFWDQIKCMSLVEDDMYDFEVADTHNLLVSSGIVVHNSMLGMALAELLPKSKLTDIMALLNPHDENKPLIKETQAGKGREINRNAQLQSTKLFKNQNILILALVIMSSILPYFFWKRGLISDIVYAASMITGVIFIVGFMLFLNISARTMNNKVEIPKLIVDNYGKKTAPFYDATGAHAGALLGDVLHDPFQSLSSSNKITIIDDKSKLKTITSNELIDNLFKKHSKKIMTKKKKNYEAIFLPEKELSVLGETNGSISPVEVLSSNRYDYEGEMIKLTTSENKELIVTPEHKIAVWKDGRIEYIEAQDIKNGNEVVAKSEDIIIDEQDIINTYDERQQKLSLSYYKYLELRKQNPSWGYKRIATKLGVSYGRTRWWWDNNSKPVPIQTVEWLKKKGLIPLRIDTHKLHLITKVLGATFGDGGIFENLNGIFLSSSNYHDVDEFSKDLQNIFGNDVILNAELREGGEYGHSWCLTNTNRNIIRFFIALGTPKGKKTNKELNVPTWIKLSEELEDEFYGSLFGSELGVSACNKLPRIEFSITGPPSLEQNRMEFLNDIINYLKKKDVIVTKRKIDVSNIRTKERGLSKNKRYRFILSQYPMNINNFAEEIKINYCNLKKWKIISSVDGHMREKLHKYLDLRAKGLGAESIMKKLEISPKYLYKVLNNTKTNLEQVEAHT